MGGEEALQCLFDPGRREKLLPLEGLCSGMPDFAIHAVEGAHLVGNEVDAKRSSQSAGQDRPKEVGVSH